MSRRTAPTIRLRLDHVSFIDPSGLRVIHRSNTDAREAGGNLVLERPGSR